MTRVMVTGGSGFIGSHVVDKLADAGFEPRIFDLIPSPHHAPGEIDTVCGSLDDAETLREAMGDCDFVIHLAAAADVGIVAKEPVMSEHLNARGTMAVLEAARETGVKRVLYGSTIWVYGESGEGDIDEDSPIGLPPHLYTASKFAGEMYCSSYAELFDVPYTILRFGIPYGPRARPAAVIPIFVRKALAGEPLTLAGDGMQTRRFIYVEDLAEGVVRGLDECAENRVYNLASNETVTIKELAHTVGDLVGDTDIVHTPGRTGDFGGAEISSERAREELGWAASTPLRDGVDSYMTWLKATTPAEEPALAAVNLVTPAPVAAAMPAMAAMATATASPTAAPGIREPRSAEQNRLITNLPLIAAVCAMGTLIAWGLAIRFDIQEHTVALTTLFAIPVLFCLVPNRLLPRTKAVFATGCWILAIYLVLLVLPWTRHALGFGLPHIKALLLTAVGVGMATVVAVSVNRLRPEETEAVPDRSN